MNRMVRHIMPLRPRVLVKVLAARAEPTDPKDGFGVNVAGVPHGAKVIFGKTAGVKVPWDDELRLLETNEVLATVDEIREDEMS